MKFNTHSNSFKEACSRLGVKLESSQLEMFAAFYESLEQSAKKFNLTSLSGQDIVDLHFVDSISALKALPNIGKARLLDLGSGAGLPGIPIKIVAPDIQVTFLDAREKRVEFIRMICRQIGLKDCGFVHARAEDYAHGDARESFDVVISRAVSELRVLIELSAPFLKLGGTVVAMKSKKAGEELELTMAATNELGLSFLENVQFELPGSGVERHLLTFKKTSATPDIFPRRIKRIQQSSKG